jgi:DNA-binding MarR family transcriptional regulator
LLFHCYKNDEIFFAKWLIALQAKSGSKRDMVLKDTNMGVSSFLYEKIGISQQALGAIIGAKQSTLSRHDNDT